VSTVSRVATAAREWTEQYLSADEVERRMVAAALRCVARWGFAKTTVDDIAREAGVSRATAYRVFPGGRDRLVETVVHHEIGRLFHEAETEVAAVASLEDLLCTGIALAMRMLTEHEALNYLLAHEPEAVLPHFAFHRLDALLAYAAELSRPHLARFLADDEVRPAAELVARIVLSYSLNPSDRVNPRDPDSIRRLVQTYLLPAVTSATPSLRSAR
jgi:AcrR family transcriptional regulator